MAKVLVTSEGKVKVRGGKVRVGEGGDPCCCGCCTCESVIASLAGSYLLDLTGVWDVSVCDPDDSSCAGSETETTLTQPDPFSCEFSNDGLGPGDFCLSGYAVNSMLLHLEEDDANPGCFLWEVSIRFFRPDAVVDGAFIIYRQRTATCDDPTGIYDFVSSDCPAADVPATVTVS